MVIRLSDEELDPMEKDRGENWCLKDKMLKKRIASLELLETARRVLKEKQFKIYHAHVSGLKYHEIDVTEKFYRYHLGKAIDTLKGYL